MGEKETILSKFNIKDYRNDLEELLESKKFADEAKSLILSIFYKIDNFYKDYQNVKINSENKNKFLEEYINIIKDKCYEIEILSTHDVRKETKNYVDRKNGIIKCIPNENILLFSIYQLAENCFEKQDFDFVSKCVADMINKGKTINDLEPIRDFNGWSWNVEINNINNMRYNLIYQNLLILFGQEFVASIINKEDIIELLRAKTNKMVSGRRTEDFINTLSEIAIDLYNNKGKEFHEECLENKQAIEQQIEALKNRKAYINVVSKENNSFIKRVEQIDMILSDIELIKQEFSKSVLQSDGKYFCMSDVADKLEFERKNAIKKMEENNELLNPKKYLEIQDAYNKKLELYDEIEDEKEQVNVQKKLIDLQKIFLDCIKARLSKDENKKDLTKIVSEMRYYNNIPFEKCKRVTMHNDLESKYEEIVRMVIYALINEKVIDIGFSSKDFCYKILRYVFDSKIMKLDNIIIKIKFENQDRIEVEYYDGNVLDYQTKFDIPIEEIIINQKTRKIKLF